MKDFEHCGLCLAGRCAVCAGGLTGDPDVDAGG